MAKALPKNRVIYWCSSSRASYSRNFPNTADVCEQSRRIGTRQKQDRGSETYRTINLINKDMLVTVTALENYFSIMALS